MYHRHSTRPTVQLAEKMAAARFAQTLEKTEVSLPMSGANIELGIPLYRRSIQGELFRLPTLRWIL